MKNMGKLDSNSTCRNFRQVQKETTQWIAKYMMHKRITGTGQMIHWIKPNIPSLTLQSGEAPQLRRFFLSFFLSPASDAGSSWWLRLMPSDLLLLPSTLFPLTSFLFLLTYLLSFASSFPQKSVQLSETPLGLSCLSLTIRSIRVIRVQKSLPALSARHKIQSVESVWD